MEKRFKIYLFIMCQQMKINKIRKYFGMAEGLADWQYEYYKKNNFFKLTKMMNKQILIVRQT